MAKPRGLGRGLKSLLGDDLTLAVMPDKSNGITEIELSKLQAGKYQPRTAMEQEKLQELADSIREQGVISPIIIRPIAADKYEIIAGERRWRAAKMAGLKKVPVIIKDLTEQEIVEISLIENIQRENLNPIEEAIAYKRLLNEFNLKQDEVAERVSKSRTAVTNSMRLLKLCDKVQQMVIDDMISTGHARALLGITDEEKQYTLAQKIFDEKISVRDTEKLVKKMQKQKNAPAKEVNPEKKKLDAVYQEAEEKMKTILGTKVIINQKDSMKGKIEIEYYSPDELTRIYELIESIKK